jgi:hydrogenase nickel incorporation protein HypA/HybF
MHEASIVESLLDLVVQSVPGHERVRRIDVRVGLLTGVSPDSMQLYFELLREGTICAEAELAVSLEPLLARCEGCGADHSFHEAVWACPACGAGSLSFRNGDELHLSSIEVDNGEGIHAGAADTQAQQ